MCAKKDLLMCFFSKSAEIMRRLYYRAFDIKKLRPPALAGTVV